MTRLSVVFTTGPASAVPLVEPVVVAPPGAFAPGAPGSGDPYFPLDGNGAYDVSVELGESGRTRGLA